MKRATHPSRTFMRGFAMRRVLKWAGIVAGALIAFVVVAAFWLLDTQSGARFAVARALGAMDGKLSIEQSSGTIAGPLELAHVRYHDPGAGVDARVARVRVDLAPWALLAWRVHVVSLDIDDVDVALATTPPKPEQPSAPFSPAAPIDIALDRLTLKKAAISQDGKPVFAADSLDLAGAWTANGAAVKTLALRAPDGSVDLNGTISAMRGYPGNGQASFHWKAGDNAYAGTLKASGNGRQAQLDVSLTAPTAATVTASIAQSDALPWTAKIAIPRFDPKLVQKDSKLGELALSLQGSGDKQKGAVDGEIDVGGHHVRLDPLRYALAGKTLKIEALTLKSADAAGTLNANGEVHLDAQPVSATLTLGWDGVELPADLVGQALATHGKLDASGSAAKFHAEGALSIGPPGNPADIAVNVDGTEEAITLNRLTLNQTKGKLETAGTIALKPAIGWKLTAKADRFDPGAFAPDWPGALDFDLASDGTLTDQGPQATVKLDRLSGTLRQRAVSGSADLKIAPGYVVDGKLDIASGHSRVDVIGRGGGETDATIKLAIASLGDWLPDAQGRLAGDFRVHGRWPKLAIDGHANGSGIASGTMQVGTVDLVANIADVQAPQGSLKLHAGKVAAGGLEFETLTIDGDGTRAAHELRIEGSGAPLGLDLALSGAAKDDGSWSGTLKTLDLAVKDAPKLALEHPAELAWNGKAFTASEICLAGGGPKLCVAGNGGADGSADARYRIEALPLALVVKLASPDAPLKVDGTIDGHGEVRRDAAGVLNGTAAITSGQGSIAYPDSATKPLIAYTDFAIDAHLAPQATHATVRAALDHDGKLDGDVTLSGAPGSDQALSGRLDATLNSLAFVELLTTEVANTKGHVEAHYTFAGTTAAPQLNGSLALKEFATEVPSAGLKLHDGDISVRATDSEHFALEGTLKSGDGSLTLSGTGGIGADAPAKATIKGENFLAADIPAARVVISPDLTIERSAEDFRVGGSVTIPKANVDLGKLPGGGVSQASPDVVIVDAEKPGPGKVLPVIVAVTVKLGDDVKLVGFGLDGTIGGELAVDQRPGRVATGTGTLNVGGTYRAYGQNLKIESGRLLFAGTALDNPGLDIRAVRTIGGAGSIDSSNAIVAGLQVRGTALVPVLTVFSKPAMEQSEALSYLVTGKPLSSLKSGEGDMVGTAARALGSATGDLLAKGIGARLGVEAGVSDSTALGGSAFTVGKYLSPKLYLSYGVGLFTPGEVVSLKYLFSRRWNFEAQNATTGNRAGINYRWER